MTKINPSPETFGEIFGLSSEQASAITSFILEQAKLKKTYPEIIEAGLTKFRRVDERFSFIFYIGSIHGYDNCLKTNILPLNK